MVKNANVKIKSNVALSASNKFEIVGKDLGKIKGVVLYNLNPHLFDIRRVGYNGEKFGGGREQWQNYIKNLPCVSCGILGGKCDCTIDRYRHKVDFMKPFSK